MLLTGMIITGSVLWFNRISGGYKFYPHPTSPMLFHFCILSALMFYNVSMFGGVINAMLPALRNKQPAKLGPELLPQVRLL